MSRIGGFGGGGPSNSQVFLNVYDLNENNAILYPWGLGMYHSGVQIGREEYTFASQSGIFSHEPKAAPGAIFREAIPMGQFKGTSKDLDTIIQSLKPYFQGSDYHVLNKNCNAFANEFCQRLVSKEIPGYVNRMAYLGSFCSCMLPDANANQAPVDQPGSGASGSGRGGYSRVSQGGGGGGVGEVTMNPFSAPGKKLGSSSAGGGGGGSVSSETTSAQGGLQERRARLLNAASGRNGNSSSNSLGNN